MTDLRETHLSLGLGRRFSAGTLRDPTGTISVFVARDEPLTPNDLLDCARVEPTQEPTQEPKP